VSSKPHRRTCCREERGGALRLQGSEALVQLGWWWHLLRPFSTAAGRPRRYSSSNGPATPHHCFDTSSATTYSKVGESSPAAVITGGCFFCSPPTAAVAVELSKAERGKTPPYYALTQELYATGY
ncbi:unnamed protein product, partial [Ectocarpus sp. 4 AP-2014]